MRIVFDARYVNDRFPGIGRYAFNLARALAELDRDDELLLLHNPALTDSRHKLSTLHRPPRCRLVRCPVPRFLPAELVLLPRRLRSLEPDLFHSPFFLGPFRPGCPAVATIFDLILLRPHTGSIDRAVFRVAAGRAATAAAAVLTATRAAAAALSRAFPALHDKLHVTPLGVAEGFRPLSADARATVRQRLKLSGRYALHLGSHLPHKRVDLLLRAWSMLRAIDPERGGSPTLVLAGPAGPETLKLQAMAADFGLGDSVRFLGAVPESDLPEVLGGAEAIVLPSEAEGFGLPLLEAMACGTPVVASNIEALVEVAGDAAIFFPPGDAAALVAALERLFGDPEVHLAASERGRVRVQRFSWEATARATRAVYDEAVRG